MNRKRFKSYETSFHFADFSAHQRALIIHRDSLIVMDGAGDFNPNFWKRQAGSGEFDEIRTNQIDLIAEVMDLFASDCVCSRELWRRWFVAGIHG